MLISRNILFFIVLLYFFFDFIQIAFFFSHWRCLSFFWDFLNIVSVIFNLLWNIFILFLLNINNFLFLLNIFRRSRLWLFIRFKQNFDRLWNLSLFLFFIWNSLRIGLNNLIIWFDCLDIFSNLNNFKFRTFSIIKYYHIIVISSCYSITFIFFFLYFFFLNFLLFNICKLFNMLYFCFA